MAHLRASRRIDWLWWAAALGGAIPLLWLAWDTWQGSLSVNPIDDFTDRTGKAAIILLILSLACTPAQIVFGYKQALTARKPLGLWAFTYAALHLLVFVGLDYGFDFGLILSDGLPQKRYIVVGFAAFLILLALALTSTRGAMRRMGRNWKRLHQWVYGAALLAALHFLWLVKAAERWEPGLYGALILLLLAVRLPRVRGWFTEMRRRRDRGAPTPPRRPAPALSRLKTAKDG